MARYQLRTPDYLEDIITEMADQGLRTLKIWGALKTNTNGDFNTFRKAIRNAMEERTRTYKLCGLSNICTDHLKSTDWSPDSHVLDANPYDRIYHVFPLTSLDDFLTELTSKSILSIQEILNSKHEEEACTMLRAIFKLVLGKYLYIDRVCGKTELCVYSSSAPKNIWQKKNARGELIEELAQY
jgi:hypothetical protein